MPLSIPIKVRCSNPSCQVGELTLEITHPGLPENFSGALIAYAGQREAPCPTCSVDTTAVGEVITFFRGAIERRDEYSEIVNGWNIRFTHCILNSQEYGTDSEHMNSKVYFQMSRVGDANRINIIQSSCIIRQDYGENFSFETSPLSVENPPEISGQVNYGEFRDAVERYFRLLIGPQGAAMSIGQNVTNLRIINQTMMHEFYAVIHDSGDNMGPW